MLIILLSLFVAGRCQTAEIDICRCNKEEIVIVCETDGGNLFLTKGTPGCHDSGMGLRVTGEGFVSGCDFKDTSMRDVFIQRSTLGCEDVLFHFPKATITLNGAVCRTSAAATTKEPRPRPPAFPVGDDEADDDDHNGDDDDDDGDNSDDDSDIDDESDDYDDVTTTNATTTVTTTTRLRVIIHTTSFSMGHWWWIVSVGVAIAGGCILVVIRIRFGRRRRQPIQDASVSSTSMDHAQEHIQLEQQIPRSPRRRRTSSMESVTLYAVNEHLD